MKELPSPERFKNRKTKAAMLTDELWFVLALNSRNKEIPSIYLYADEVIRVEIEAMEHITPWVSKQPRRQRNLRIRDELWEILVLRSIKENCHTWQLLETLLRQDLRKKGLAKKGFDIIAEVENENTKPFSAI